MSLESKRERFVYQGLIPVIAAIVGAIAATWVQSANIDQAQLSDVVSMLKDPALSADQKLQALNLYKEITDRPWAILRSLTTMLTMSVSIAVGAAVAGGFFIKKHA